MPVQSEKLMDDLTDPYIKMVDLMWTLNQGVELSMHPLDRKIRRFLRVTGMRMVNIPWHLSIGIKDHYVVRKRHLHTAYNTPNLSSKN